MIALGLIWLASLGEATMPVQSAHWAAEFERAMRDFDDGQQVLHKQPDRARQHFRSAAQRLGSIAGAGVSNGYLEYNLGNCHLQAGDLGRAILHYRRAHKLIPRDPLLADNLALARSRRLTQIQTTRRDAVLRNLLFWRHRTSQTERAYAGIGLYVLAFAFLAGRAFVRRRSLAMLAAIAGILALASGGSVMAERWSQRNEPAAVVTALDVVVSKGPGPGYQRQFEQPLQPGVECLVKEQRDRWWRIELPDGNSGWIEASAAELVDSRSHDRTVFLR